MKDEEDRKRDHETTKLAAKSARDIWDKKVKEAIEAGVPPPAMPEAAVDPVSTFRSDLLSTTARSSG